MTRTQQAILAIRIYLDKRGNTKAELAKRAGVHENTLARVRDEGWNPKAETLHALELAVNRSESGGDVAG